MSLKNRSVSAALWSGADVLVRQSLQLGTSIVLARLLAPEEFGTIALLYLFVGLGGLFIDGYFNAALVQRQDITHQDESTVFWFNAMAGAAVALVLCAAAPAIEAFYGMAQLRPLTYAMALNLSIGSLTAVPITLLSKELDFRTPMRCGAIAAAVSGIVAIALALNGVGVWSIAAQTLTFSSMYALLIWHGTSWRPAFCFDAHSLKKLIRFSGFMWLGAVLDTFYTQLYSVIIGKRFGVRDLGFYSRALGTQQIPSNLLMAILGRVLFPTFSAATADRDLLVRGVRRALVTVMLVNIPAMLGLMATAEAAVVTLFGDVWRPSAGLLRVLCLVGLFAPLNAINTNVLLAQGHSQRYLRIEIVKKLAGVLLLLAASPFGLVAMAWGQVVAAGAGFFLSAYYTGRLLGYPATHQLHDIAPFGVVGIVMGLLVWLLGGMLGPPGARVLALQCAVGLVVYVTTCRAMKLEALNALAGLAADRWRRIKGPDHDRNGLMREHP